DPDLRFQSASELRVSLKRLAGVSSSSGPASSAGSGTGSSAGAAPLSSAAPASSARNASAVGVPPTGVSSAKRRWIGIAAVVALAAVGWWWWQGRGSRGAAAPSLSFRQLTYTGQVQDAAISPDGKFLAHVEAGPQGSSLHLLSVAKGGAGSSDVQIMPPAPGCCTSPSFSPDGSTVYFVEDRTLMMIPVLGGAVRTVAEEVCSGAGVAPDGQHLAYLKASAGGDQLMVANSDGTQAKMLSDARPDGYDSRCWLAGPLYPDTPVWSPDGGTIAVQRSGGGTNVSDHLTLVNARDGSSRALGPDLGQSSSDVAWLPDASGLLLALAKPGTEPS